MDPRAPVEIRRAEPADADAIAAAHLDSIRSIGPRYYEPAIVHDWGGRVEAGLYLRAMARGEVFFVANSDAIDASDAAHTVLGFS